jgi:hypothetical protein
MNRPLVAWCLAWLSVSTYAAPAGLFDGKTFAGWNGDTNVTWRIENGSIIGGKAGYHVPRNEFLVTEREFSDFELTLKFKLVLEKGPPNAGIQVRSQRVPNHHEMVGYQADLGDGYWGCLYDESRRNKVLARPANDPAVLASLKKGDWNDYRIRCQGPRIQLWINQVPAADFSEADPAIPLTGRIGLQIHGGATQHIYYKDLRIEELK